MRDERAKEEEWRREVGRERRDEREEREGKRWKVGVVEVG